MPSRCVVLCSVTKFDPAVIKGQIDNLLAERDRIDQAIGSLQAALRNIEGIAQRELGLFETGVASTTLHDAVRRMCLSMVDGITRQRVLDTIERTLPSLRPKSSSVAAALINLAKGENPMLQVAIEGRGRSPSFYSTQGKTVHRLSGDEAKELFHESTTQGTGGWQSLFNSLQRSFDKPSGTITLTPEQRGRIYHYYRSYGGGGWQDRVKRIFRRELPHLFAS
jgi:hypothetical protein